MDSGEPKSPTSCVVTVDLDHAEGLSRTISSLDRQDYSDWTHLIQDSGSTDGSLEVTVRAEGLRRNAVSRPDGGIYDAMNHAMARVDGDLVWLLNSGDEFATTSSL